MRRKMGIYKCMLNVYKNQQNRQTGSRNMMGPKTLSMIWGTYMKLVTKYQISAINSYWEKCDEKCAYICSMCIKTNQVGKQEVGIWRVQKRYPQYGIPIWRLWPKYQISAIDSYWEKCDENILDRRKDGRTDRGKTVYPPPPSGSGGIIKYYILPIL